MKTEQITEGILQIVPRRYIHRLARSTQENKLAMTVILTPEIIERLTIGKAAMVELEDGGTLILVPQTLIEAAYGENEHER
jgi:hypothetical protein